MFDKFEVGFESGVSGSFLVINTEASEKIVTYQLEMITNNPLEGILNISLKHRDEKINLYYNITSKITLAQYLKRNKLGAQIFSKIFSQLINILIESKNYFLWDKCFILNEDLIYINPENLKISLIYLPFELNLEVNKSLKDFTMNFIMYSANLDENINENFLHKVLNLLKSEYFNILKFQQLLKEMEMNESGSANYTSISSQSNRQTYIRREEYYDSRNSEEDNNLTGKVTEDKLLNNDSMSIKGERDYDNSKNITKKNSFHIPKVSSNSEKTEKKQKVQITGSPANKNIYIIGGLIQGLIVILIIILLTSGAMNSLGNDIVANIFALVLLGGVVSFFVWKKILSKWNNEQNNIKDEVSVKINDKSIDKKELKKSENKKTQNYNNKFEKGEIPVKKAIPNKMSTINSHYKTPNNSINNEYGMRIGVDGSNKPLITNETTLLSDGANETTFLGSVTKYPFLKSMKSEGEEITVNKENFVIGRLKDQVDYVSGNSAVGKTHAEIISKDGRYYIKDLNSRNGTFINDVRLDNNIEYEVNNNDKVTLANSDYIFVIPKQ